MADRPIPDDVLARAKRRPLARRARLRAQLTQAEFAARYHLPIGTLRDWEQGRVEPDAAAIAYLTAIANAPEFIATALAGGSIAATE